MIDQLAETYHASSPYAYVVNSPISLVDPDGRGAMDAFNEYHHVPMELRPMFFTDNHGQMTLNPAYSGKGSEAKTFGETQAYKDLMATLRSGGAYSLVSKNGWFSWWTNIPDSYDAEGNLVKGVGNVYFQKINESLVNIANNRFFSIGHLVTSESVTRFGAYSLEKALRPDYSVNYTVLDDAAKPYRITTMAGIKMKPSTVATFSKAAKYGGYGLAAVSLVATELQYADGQIGQTERWANHVMTGVGLVPTPWTMGAALVYGVVTGGYQAVTGRSIFNDANDLLNQHGYYIP